MPADRVRRAGIRVAAGEKGGPVIGRLGRHRRGRGGNPDRETTRGHEGTDASAPPVSGGGCSDAGVDACRLWRAVPVEGVASTLEPTYHSPDAGAITIPEHAWCWAVWSCRNARVDAS